MPIAVKIEEIRSVKRLGKAPLLAQNDPGQDSFHPFPSIHKTEILDDVNVKNDLVEYFTSLAVLL